MCTGASLLLVIIFYLLFSGDHGLYTEPEIAKRIYWHQLVVALIIFGLAFIDCMYKAIYGSDLYWSSANYIYKAIYASEDVVA